MWDGFNKRKFPRIKLQCEIAIQSDGPKYAIHAITENVGIGGVCVILDQPLERFSKCRLRLELKSKHEIDCAAKVVWMVPTQAAKGSKKRFDTGLEFLGLEPEEGEILKAFLQKSVPKAH